MRTLNLGILAHVDAGKTSLTERLLFAAGIIHRLGSVDDGNTQTDTMALERQRGITIKAAVVSFVVGDVTVNLIDTPGHPDFIAEVERVLDVLDGAVLVVSAVEGVQAQTRILMRALKRLAIPTLILVNKIDRRGADPDRVLAGIAAALSPAAIAMGQVLAAGTPQAAFAPFEPNDAGFRAVAVERLAEADDALLAAFVEGKPVEPAWLRNVLVRQGRAALVHPVFFGSAITGAGIEALVGALTELLPAEERDAMAPVSGTVFKVERGRAGEKIAIASLSAGKIGVRERVRLPRGEATVTAIQLFEGGACVPRHSVEAGRIARLKGLADARIGDTIGAASSSREHHFAPPTLETMVLPRRAFDRRALWNALTQLAEQDPLIDLRHDEARQETFISLYGEVQKEVIGETLRVDFGVEAEFRKSSVICERPIGSGAAAEFLLEHDNPFLATVGLRVEPAPTGLGVGFVLAVNSGSMPAAFFRAVEDTVRETLRQGLEGWQVIDCIVTMTHARWQSPASTAADFRNLTPLVLMAALKEAGTVVCEPIQRFSLELPADTPAMVLPVLARLGAIPGAPVLDGAGCVIEGNIPAAHVHELQQLLPGLTRGEGVLECNFDGYRPVRGIAPKRERSDLNPLDRSQYLLRMQGRVLAAGDREPR